ncbi:coiled-coil domain-containing protein [Streptomonospora algeriensis]|uniref:Coiled-coil domain-containing protein n=1 Tax=Streptomonospora algeriensis TaxID=995084 RepID=A0ABW3BE97_9ACTN
MPEPVLSRKRSRTLLLPGLAAAAVLLLPATSSYADPQDDEPSIDELNERADSLEEEYDTELLQYEDAEENAKKAQKRLKNVEDELGKYRENIAGLAAAQYMGSGLDPTVEVVMSSEPQDMLDNAAMAGQVSADHGERIADLAELQQKRQDAVDEADARLKEAEDLVEDLESQRENVLDKIEKYEEEQVPEAPEESSGGGGGSGSGTIPSSAMGPGWDGATPRMAAIRDEIVREFGAPYPVGCLRPGDSGEHGSGRACDFMMSAGGASPSAANRQLGQQIADYAQANADRLGVMYIIWEQRIWHSANPGAGWEMMNDRGSITANHYDHVHVSSY